MVQVWRDRLDAAGAGLSRLGIAVSATLSEPLAVQRLQRGILLVAGLWCVLSAVAIAWSLMPARPIPAAPIGDIINPVTRSAAAVPAAQVDIARLASWHLFGDPDSASAEALSALEARRAAAVDARAGIEADARESRLPLLLRGVVSSRDDGLGYAMIEHRGEQAVYAVGDELPVQGRVVLAKVLSSRVVIDNGGRYELLLLYEENDLLQQASDAQVAVARTTTKPPSTGGAAPASVTVARPGLAAQYRDRLYSDPQSLAEVVQVAPVRSGAELLGYRLSPGRAGEDFAALGFQAGDIVTAINGLSLSDPANTLLLYQAMRDERSAVFELQRDGSELVLNVQLPENGNRE
ncbi:MAG: type II secretion system protein GspC [Chromatocurvus sp.]